jgi:hypothetical protein
LVVVEAPGVSPALLGFVRQSPGRVDRFEDARRRALAVLER